MALEEMSYVQQLVIAGIVIVIILVFAVNASGGTQRVSNASQALASRPIAISYIPGQGEISNPLSPDVAEDGNSVKVEEVLRTLDGYLYRIRFAPRLRVEGKGEEDVFAIIEFKGQSARAKDIQAGTVREFFTVHGGTTSTPDLVADVASTIPPITDFSSPVCNGHTVLAKNPQNDAPLLVTAYVKSVLSDIKVLPDKIADAYSCNARFHLFCDGELKTSDWMSGCSSSDPLDCQENIEVCGAVAGIRLLSDPDCGNDRVELEVNYDGSRKFAVSELVDVTFWKKTDCTESTEDINILWGTCTSDYAGGARNLKAGKLNFAEQTCA